MAKKQKQCAEDENNFSYMLGEHHVEMSEGSLCVNGTEYEDQSDMPDYTWAREVWRLRQEINRNVYAP